MATKPLRRGALAAALTMAVAVALVLSPDAVRVFASGLGVPLRTDAGTALVIGHRGDRADAPENTLPAFEAAFAAGYDTVETDVQLSADGVPVLMHDLTVDRTTDGTGAVAELTLAELQRLDAGSWYGPEFAGTRIPTLAQFLGLLDDSGRSAVIELKADWGVRQLEPVLTELYSRGLQNRIVFASFSSVSLESVHEAAAGIPRIAITKTLPRDPVAFAARFDAAAVMTTAASLDAEPAAVRRLHEAGIGVMLYTLNSTRRWTDAISHGVDGIVSDEPGRLHSWLLSASDR